MQRKVLFARSLITWGEIVPLNIYAVLCMWCWKDFRDEAGWTFIKSSERLENVQKFCPLQLCNFLAR